MDRCLPPTKATRLPAPDRVSRSGTRIAQRRSIGYISTTISVTNVCVSNRTVKIAFSKRAKAGRVRFNGKTIKAKRIHGRLRATVSFRGMKAAPGSYAAVVMRSKMHGKWSSQTRLYKLC
jgi:hypothetical protein